MTGKVECSVVVRRFGAREVVATLDEVAVTCWGYEREIGADSVSNNGEVRDVVPVRKHDRTDIAIIVFLGRSIDYHGTHDSSRVLGAVMCVVPTGSVKLCLVDIGERVPWSNGALTNCRHTVIPGSFFLEHTVPVHRCSFQWIVDLVMDSHVDNVSPVCLYGRPRVLSIDQDDVPFYSVR